MKGTIVVHNIKGHVNLGFGLRNIPADLTATIVSCTDGDMRGTVRPLMKGSAKVVGAKVVGAEIQVMLNRLEPDLVMPAVWKPIK